MSIRRVCDRCLNWRTVDGPEIRPNVTGWSKVQMVEGLASLGEPATDLCPDCCTALVHWIRTPPGRTAP